MKISKQDILIWFAAQEVLYATGEITQKEFSKCYKWKNKAIQILDQAETLGVEEL